MKIGSVVLLPLLANLAVAASCPKKFASKLVCYYGEVAPVDPCKCTHVILAPGVDAAAVRKMKAAAKGAKLFVSVSEFNEKLVSLLNATKLDGVEVDLRKMGSRADVTDFVSTVRAKLGADLAVAVAVPARPELLAKYFDFKSLAKHQVDLFVLQTAFLAGAAARNATFHPSRLSGLWDMQNIDSVVDLVSGLGVPLSKLVIASPVQAFRFQLQSAKHTAPGAPALSVQSIDRNELCDTISKGNWTLERDQDQAGPYVFSKDQWIAFDDKTSIDIKAKYSRVRGLAGLALKDVSQDGGSKCGGTLLDAAFNGLSHQSRAPRGAILHSLEREIVETYASPVENIHVSPYRISRIIDTEGTIHAIREDTRTEFRCTRQGYFVHPRSCNRFYRCVKFDQLSNDFNVFEFDCPAGLAFDETVEVCVWPGSLPHGAACSGSSEIAAVPKQRFVCPHEPGYYVDPENCRWFFACLDHGQEGLSAYEFRCPFGLVYDESRLLCEWPWLVPKCGAAYAATTNHYYGSLASGTLGGYDGFGTLRNIALGGFSGPIEEAKIYTNVGSGGSYLNNLGSLSLKNSQILENSGFYKNQGFGYQQNGAGYNYNDFTNEQHTIGLGNKGYQNSVHHSKILNNDGLGVADTNSRVLKTGVSANDALYTANFNSESANRGVFGAESYSHSGTANTGGGTLVLSHRGQGYSGGIAAENARSYYESGLSNYDQTGKYDSGSGALNNVNIVGGGYSTVGVEVTNNGENAHSNISTTVSPIHVSTAITPTVSEVPLPQKTDQLLEGGVVANLPELQYKVQVLSTPKPVVFTTKTVHDQTGYDYTSSHSSSSFTSSNLNSYASSTNRPLLNIQQQNIQVQPPRTYNYQGDLKDYQYSRPFGFVQAAVNFASQYNNQKQAETDGHYAGHSSLVYHQTPILQNMFQNHQQIGIGSSFVDSSYHSDNLKYRNDQTFLPHLYSVPTSNYSFIGHSLGQWKGYTYPKPSVSFTEEPFKYIPIKSISTGYVYPVPKIPFVQTNIQYGTSTVKPELTVTSIPQSKQVTSGYVYPTPSIPFTEEKIVPQVRYLPATTPRPAVVIEKSLGYTYPQPQKVFIEEPAVVPYSVSTTIKPIVPIQKQIPVVPIVPQPKVVHSGYDYPKPAVSFIEEKNLHQPAVEYLPTSTSRPTVLKETQPVVYSFPKPQKIFVEEPKIVSYPVTSTMKPPVVLQEIQQPAVPSYPSVVHKPKDAFSGYVYSTPAVPFTFDSKVIHQSLPAVEKRPTQGYVYSVPQKQLIEEPPLVAFPASSTVKPFVSGGQIQFTNYQTLDKSSQSYIQQPVISSPQTSYDVRANYSIGYNYPTPKVNGYVYTKPSVSFVEQPIQAKSYGHSIFSSISHQSNKEDNYKYSATPKVEQVGYTYSTSPVPFIEKKIVQTPLVTKGYTYPQPQVKFVEEPFLYNQASLIDRKINNFEKAKESVLFKEQPIVISSTPATVSSYFIQPTPNSAYKSDIREQSVQFKGYNYPKPAVAFTEGPPQTVTYREEVQEVPFVAKKAYKTGQPIIIENYEAANYKSFDTSSNNKLNYKESLFYSTPSPQVTKCLHLNEGQFYYYDSRLNSASDISTTISSVEASTESAEALLEVTNSKVGTDDFNLGYLPVPEVTTIKTTPSVEYLPVKAKTRRPTIKIVKIVRPKTIIKTNDIHPLLPNKLGAQCICTSNRLTLTKKAKMLEVTNQYNTDYDDDEYVNGEGHGSVVDNYTFNRERLAEIAANPLKVQSAEITPNSQSVIVENEYQNNDEKESEVSDKEISKAVRTGIKLVKEAVRKGTQEAVRRNQRIEDIVDCQRAGLFRHPTECNKFYSCRWDRSKNKFVLHVFKCPIQLTFDNNLGACNWPSQGPACMENTLLPISA